MPETGKFRYVDKVCEYDEHYNEKCYEVEIEIDLEELLRSLANAVPLMYRAITGDKENMVDSMDRLQERLKMPVSIGISNKSGVRPALLVDHNYQITGIIARVSLASGAYIIIRAREVSTD